MFLSHGRGSVLLLGLLVPGLVLISGCGGKSKGTVTGKVYYGDTLVRGGHVIFLSADGKTAYPSEIDKDGNYKVPGFPVGEAMISVETESMNRKQNSRQNLPPPGTQTDYKGSGGVSPEEALARYTWIPLRYNDTKTSRLTYTVKPGSQEYDIKLPVEQEGALPPQ